MKSAINYIKRRVSKEKKEGYGGLCIQLEDIPSLQPNQYDDIVSWIRNNYHNVRYAKDYDFLNCNGVPVGHLVSFDFEIDEERQKEHELALWFEEQRELKRQGKIFESVDKMLSDNFGANWHLLNQGDTISIIKK